MPGDLPFEVRLQEVALLCHGSPTLRSLLLFVAQHILPDIKNPLDKKRKLLLTGPSRRYSFKYIYTPGLSRCEDSLLPRRTILGPDLLLGCECSVFSRLLPSQEAMQNHLPFLEAYCSYGSRIYRVSAHMSSPSRSSKGSDAKSGTASPRGSVEITHSSGDNVTELMEPLNRASISSEATEVAMALPVAIMDWDEEAIISWIHRG